MCISRCMGLLKQDSVQPDAMIILESWSAPLLNPHPLKLLVSYCASSAFQNSIESITDISVSSSGLSISFSSQCLWWIRLGLTLKCHDPNTLPTRRRGKWRCECLIIPPANANQRRQLTSPTDPAYPTWYTRLGQSPMYPLLTSRLSPSTRPL